MIHNTKHSGYALNYNGTVFTRQKRRQLGGSIFSAIFSGLKSLIAPLFGSLTKATVKQAAISGGKELLKSAGKAALEEGGPRYRDDMGRLAAARAMTIIMG